MARACENCGKPQGRGDRRFRCGVCKKLVCFKCERGGVCRVCQAEREQADRRNRSFAQFDSGKTCPEVREFFGFSREMTSQLFQEWRESRREAE